MNSPGELFQNNQLDVSQLPAVDQLETIPLEPAYRTVRYITGIIIAVIMVTIAWVIVAVQPQLYPYGNMAAVFITLLALWIIFYYGVSFKYMGYALREKDVSFSSGWLWRNVTTVPFNRVQHCDFKQGLLDRRFGIAKLTIYTAGGQNTDLMIPGLLPETAEKLKSYILESTEQSAEED